MRTDLYAMFRKNFPFIIRDKHTALDILSDSANKVLERRNDKNELIGVSVINKNTIYMLCVNKEYRHRGIGSALLEESEKYIAACGYEEIQVGAGDNYLTPGIPMRTKPVYEQLEEDQIYLDVTNEANEFFEKRGYRHSWNGCNCFDMRADYSKINFPDNSVGDTIDGILYRWAAVEDIPKIIECTDDAHQPFSDYYRDMSIYRINGEKRVLLAEDGENICGTLIVCRDEEKEIGSVGCTTVRHSHRGRHIGVHLVVLGNKALKEQGMKEGYLSYTYSGLDKMYGYAGYKICVYYNMAKKSL